MDVWRLASLRREYVLSRLRFSVLFFSVLVERDRDVRQVTVFRGFLKRSVFFCADRLGKFNAWMSGA